MKKRMRKEVVALLASTLALGAAWIATHDNALRRLFAPRVVIANGEGVRNMAFSPDGSLLAVGSASDIVNPITNALNPKRFLQVWNTKNLKPMWEKREELKGFTPDGRHVVAGTPNSNSKATLLQSADGVQSSDSPQSAARIANTQGRYAPWLTVKEWTPKNEAVRRAKYKSHGPRTFAERGWFRVWNALPSPSGRHVVAVASRIHNVMYESFQVWDSETGKVLSEFGSYVRPIRQHGDANKMAQAFFVDDNTIVVSSGPPTTGYQLDSTLSWWDWRRRKCLRRVKMGPTYEAFLSPTREYILRCQRFDDGKKNSVGSALEAFDAHTGKRLWRYQGLGVIDEEWLGFSRDGARICFIEGAKPSGGYQTVLCDNNGKVLARYPNSRYVVISQDGRQLATSRGGGRSAGEHDSVALHDISNLQ